MSKSCPSCQAEVKKSSGTCNVCGWSFTDALQKTNLVVRPAVRPKIQTEIELAFAIDRTGSSLQFATGIPKIANLILEQIEEKARKVTCRVQTHGDQDEGQMPILVIEDATVDQAIEEIKKITYEGGGDPAEHHLDGIEHLLNTTPWSLDPSRSRGAILAFLTADSKPSTNGASPSEIGQKIKEQGILLYLVCQPTKILRELVEAAEGLMFEITNKPDPEDLQRIASQLAASIVSTIGSGATAPLNPVTQ
jgi:hypothetical protein